MNAIHFLYVKYYVPCRHHWPKNGATLRAKKYCRRQFAPNASAFANAVAEQAAKVALRDNNITLDFTISE